MSTNSAIYETFKIPIFSLSPTLSLHPVCPNHLKGDKLFCVQIYKAFLFFPDPSPLSPPTTSLIPREPRLSNFGSICKSVNLGLAQQQPSPLVFVSQSIHRAIFICPKGDILGSHQCQRPWPPFWDSWSGRTCLMESQLWIYSDTRK